MNPFGALYGQTASGDLFIGRTEKCKELRDRILSNSCASIYGLPRMGKSSLLLHVTEEQSDFWLNMQKVVINLTPGRSSNKLQFWISILKNLHQKITEYKKRLADIDPFTTMTFEELDTIYSEGIQNLIIDDLFDSLKSYLEKINSELELQSIICIDEFQKVVEIQFDRQDFYMMRELTDAHLATFIVATRKSFRTIELTFHKYPYFENTFQEIPLNPFEDNDVLKFWEKWLPAYKELVPFDKLDKVKDLVMHYSGNHPNLLVATNYHLWSLLDNGVIELDSIDDYVELESKMHKDFAKDLAYTLNLLEGEGLKDLAIQLVKGPLINYSRDEANRLVELGFLRKIPARDKFQLFGTQVGPVFSSDSTAQNPNAEPYAYVCLSDYYSSLFYFELSSDKPAVFETDTQDGLRLRYYWEWSQTENKMRDLICYYLENKYGKGCLGQDPTSRTYKEIWEQQMLNDISQSTYGTEPATYKGAKRTKKDIWLEVIFHAKERRSRAIKRFGQKAETSLIYYLETGDLWYQFFDADWDSFSKVFDNDFQLMQRDWENKVFKPLNDDRNYPAHSRIELFDKGDFEKNHDLCNKISKAIDKYITKSDSF